MKILLGVPEYPPHHIGGGGEVFKNLAEGYKKEGHEVVVIYGYYKAKGFEGIKEFTDNGVKFYQIPEIPYPKSFPFLKTIMPIGLINYYKLKKIIKKENFDVANLHGYGLFFVNQIAIILNNLKIRYILTLHGAPVSPDKMKGIIGFVYNLYKNFLGNKLLNFSYKITAVSKYTTTFKEFENYKTNIVVINNGINIEKYKYDKNINKIIEGNYIKFLSLGRIEWLKGFQLFIPILAKLKQDGFDVKYYIAGRDNGYKSELLDLIKKFNLEKNIIFLGFLDFQEKVNTIYESDYIVIPSLVENYPAVPIESIICGRIPIGNNIGGIPEIINEKNGLCLNLENIENSFLEIKELLNGKIKFNNVNKSIFSWNNIVKQYLKLMK